MILYKAILYPVDSKEALISEERISLTPSQLINRLRKKIFGTQENWYELKRFGSTEFIGPDGSRLVLKIEEIEDEAP